MNKIGILTYHTGYNYGASLQAYALQTVIKRYGLDCETINFETIRFLASREMFSRQITRPKELIKILTRIPYYSTLKKRQKLFDKFTNECLSLSKLYRTEQEVINHAEDYDCIVCGSDQIWNLGEGDAPAANPLFFLNFPKKQRRISYAASFGKWVKEAPNHEDIFLKWLKEFDAISVREQSGVDYVQSKGLPCEISLDPTVLLDKEDYDEICADRQIQEPYILMFGWHTNNDLIEVSKRVSGELKLPVYNIVPPPRGIGSGIKRKLDVGPREFLSMIKHAEFVVTNSFHGTAFSATYEKPFLSIVSGKADTRMESLLHQLGLSDYLVTPDKVSRKLMVQPSYADTKEKKTELRAKSFAYLEKALGVSND